MIVTHLEEDIKARLSPIQREKIKESIQSGKFVTHFNSIEEVKHPDLSEQTSKCIYLWRRKVTIFWELTYFTV